MKFEELLKKYKDGTATPEEAAAVEEDLEKVRLIEEYLAEEDAPLPLPEVAAAGEVKAVQRTIKHRTRNTALAVVAGVLAVLLLLQYVLLPAANRRVFDDSHDDNKPYYPSEYELFMDTLTQLGMPFYRYYGTGKTITGFGQWTLVNTFRGLNGESVTLDFYLTAGFLDTNPAAERLVRMFSPTNCIEISDSFQQHGYDTGDEALQRLDNSIAVAAAVSFNRELTLEEVLALQEQYPEVEVWSAVLTQQYYRPIQLTLVFNGMGWGDAVNENYPLLWASNPAKMTSEMWQQHLESQLQYVIDHQHLLQHFDPNVKGYSRLLADVQKGATFRGLWVIGTGEELLSLYDSGVVGDIWGMDAYIAL